MSILLSTIPNTQQLAFIIGFPGYNGLLLALLTITLHILSIISDNDTQDPDIIVVVKKGEMGFQKSCELLAQGGE